MKKLEDIVNDAKARGLVTCDNPMQFAAFLSEQGVYVKPDSAQEQASEAGSDREFPRFVRGFHDILITIGVLLGLGGLSGINPVYLPPIGILILSELLVRRQRLALPAVTLSMALAVWAVQFYPSSYLFSPNNVADVLSLQAATALFATVVSPVLMGLYYWRYRVPLAFSICIVSVISAPVLFVLQGLYIHTGSFEFFSENIRLYMFGFAATAFVIFMAALRFDSRDRERRTSMSDVAFWLHMAAAPLFLYSLISGLTGKSVFTGFGSEDSDMSLIVFAIVTIMLVVGVIIDRRVFVTAGLLSLGYLVYRGISQGAFFEGYTTSLTFVAIGLFVLGIGVGWNSIRRLVVNRLPMGLVRRLPPV